MLNEIKLFSGHPRTGRYFYQGLASHQRVEKTREMLRGDLARLRWWRDRQRELIETCDGGTPRLYVGSAMDLSSEPYIERLRPNALYTVAAVFVVAGSEEQARQRLLEWRETNEEMAPLIPVSQTWWPAMMRAVAGRLAQRLKV